MERFQELEPNPNESICPECDDLGTVPGDRGAYVRCECCKGTGRIPTPSHIDCLDCYGSGREVRNSRNPDDVDDCSAPGCIEGQIQNPDYVGGAA